MSQKEEEFPFEDLVQALTDDAPLKPSMRPILTAVASHNSYWTYSVVSTLVQILRSREEEPSSKCRCLQAVLLLVEVYQYPVMTLLEVYLLPILREAALFLNKKTDEQIGLYFQQIWAIQDTPQLRKVSQEFIYRAMELIFLTAEIKPFRMVEVEQIGQKSNFAQIASEMESFGIMKPKKWRWVSQETIKQGRSKFLAGLRRFQEQSQGWAQFLLVNLLQQVKSNKKELLQLRQLLAYGQSYLTSPLINVCEDELNDLNDSFEQKKRFLVLLNELVRGGDIQAIIMIKNSDFLPSITSQIVGLPGHLGAQAGELIFPQIQSTKQAKRQFYCDFLRALECWAKAMPKDYDAEEFNVFEIYRMLKQDKKFKFPQNLTLGRFEKETKENLKRNKERNDKLIQMLEQATSRLPSLSAPFSRNNQNQKTQHHPSLSAQVLKQKLQSAQRDIKQLLEDPNKTQALLLQLTMFKDNWIGYLEALDLEEADEEELEAVVSSGEKCVEQIQMIIPLGAACSKGKITYAQFRQRVIEGIDSHRSAVVSRGSQLPQSQRKSISISISHLKSMPSQHSKTPKSKITGRQLRSRLKQKSKLRTIDPNNQSRVLDRSAISKHTDRGSRMVADRSRVTDRSKFTQKSRVNLQEGKEKSRINELHSNFRVLKSQFKETSPIIKQEKGEDQRNSLSKVNKSGRSDIEKEKSVSVNVSNVNEGANISGNMMKSKQASKMTPEIHVIQDYSDNIQTNKKLTSSSRKSGSKIIMRRSNGGSRLQRSKDSHRSDRQSAEKQQKSLQNAPLVSLSSTKKVSEINSNIRRSVKGEETIEINANSIKEASLTHKKSDKLKRESHFDDFKDGHKQISSIIHSSPTSKAEELHDEAEKILSTVKKEVYGHFPNQSSQKNISQYSIKSAQKDRQQQQQDDSNDIITDPEYSPMRHSFHPQQSSHRSPILLSENPQFKQVFTNKYQGIQSRQREQKILTNNNKNATLKNIIKTSRPKAAYRPDSLMYQVTSQERRLQSQKDIESPRLHMQYGGSYHSSKDIEFQELEQLKNREILKLREKIRELEMETMSMRTKLAVRDNELRSMRNGSAAGSERNFLFTSPGQSHYDRTSHSKSEKGSLRGSSVGKRQVTVFQREVEGAFKQYLQRIKGTTFRKSLLKQKCLINKSDELQIGCLSQMGETIMQATLYITPQRFDLTDFSISVQHDSNIKVKITPQYVKTIMAKRQQKVHLTVEVLRLPFCLAELQINYKAASEYASNYHRVVLPLAFNKFCSVFVLQKTPQSHLGYLRTDDFKLDTKVVKLQRLKQAFQGWSIIPPVKDRQQWLVLAQCGYRGCSFSVCLNLGERNSWIQGFLVDGDANAMRFFICTMKDILDGGKK